MLHRTKKNADPNAGKWLGVGGKLQRDESPAACVRREVLEETGLSPARFAPRGVITFVSDRWETEYMFLYTADSDTPAFRPCDEGDLEWVEKEKVFSLPLWEGDRRFLRLLIDGAPYIEMTLRYRGAELVSCEG